MHPCWENSNILVHDLCVKTCRWYVTVVTKDAHYTGENGLLFCPT